jgi:hypothetical protein
MISVPLKKNVRKAKSSTCFSLPLCTLSRDSVRGRISHPDVARGVQYLEYVLGMV